jgi:predicted amidohydrolase/GNAT superfamily N-acetyltransferase
MDGRIVGYATSIIVQLDDSNEWWYTWDEITGGGTFSTHEPGGDTLYGADIAVHPDFRKKGVSTQLYKNRKELLKRYNLRRMLAYGRITGFHNYEGKMTAQQYVNRVCAGKLKDPALNAHLKAGYRVNRVLFEYVEDEASLNYCTVLEMPNKDFKPERRHIAAMPLGRPIRKIRICAAQYLMRRIDSWEEFEQSVSFFIDTADTYHCHFLLLPELFTAQLFSTFPPELSEKKAIRTLAALADKYIAFFKAKAQAHQLHIIAGSHPIKRKGKIYNVAHLFTPSGNVYTQDKLHITPAERDYWGIQPGESLKIFETEYGRIAIQVCYDIEFPEPSRLLTLAGAEVIFVPFSTDEKKSYYRVRYCSQARAVENYLYVVLAGNVGNLPQVKSYLINYGQSAVFTPSDFAFPLDAIQGQAEPNEETVVITELDLTSLSRHRDSASVRPLTERRLDLFEIQAKQKVEVVRTE